MTSAGARAGGRRALRGPGSGFHADGSGNKEAGGGWEATHKAGNTIPWENWLCGAFFRGFQKTAGPHYILFIYRPDVALALCTEGVGSAARVRVDVTQMLFKGACGLSASPLFPGGTGPSGRHRVPELCAAAADRGMLHPILAPFAAATSGFSRGSVVQGCPRLPSRSSRGRRSRRLSPPFERGRQMLSRLLRRWARKQRAAFKDQSSAGPDPPLRLPILPQNTNTPPSPHPVPLSGGAASPQLPPASRRDTACLGAASRASAAQGQSSSFITLCRPGPAVAVCNREAGRERKFLKSASARTENICPGGKRFPRGARGSRRA